jgi:hypothetical protein
MVVRLFSKVVKMISVFTILCAIVGMCVILRESSHEGKHYGGGDGYELYKHE